MVSIFTKADFLFSVGNIGEPVKQLEPVKDNSGYFSVRFDGILEAFHDGIRDKFLESYNAEQLGSEFLDRSSVITMTENMFSSTSSKSRAYEILADIFLQPRVPSKASVSFKQKGPSAVSVCVLPSDGNHLAEVRVDTVPCFKLSSWPDNWGSEEFLNRTRKWPSDPKIVKEVQDMVHIVPKCSPKLKVESQKEMCWRLSFSEAEVHFMSLFSDDEARACICFSRYYSMPT